MQTIEQDFKHNAISLQKKFLARFFLKNISCWLGVMAHTYNHFERPRQVYYLRSGIWDQPVQYGKIPPLLKIQKLAKCGTHACNPSYLGGAKAQELLEPGRQRLQWAEITHFTPGWWQNKTPSQKKKKTNKQREKQIKKISDWVKGVYKPF